MVTNEIRTIENLRMLEVSIPVQHNYQNKIQIVPAKSLGTHLLILPCFAISPSPPRTMLFCGQKIGMTGRSATLLECWDNNLRNQHSFGGEGVFEPDGYG